MTTAEAPVTVDQIALPLLTVSSARTFRSCPRNYLHRYVEGYELVGEKAAALRFGTMIHTGLEAWWKAVPDDARLTDALAAIQPKPGEECDPFELVKAEELLRGYDARWGAEVIETLAVESEFNAALLNPETGGASRTFRLAGKLDVVARLADGRVVLIEHKTSSDDITPGSDYWKRLVIDAQVSTYFVGARALGFDVVACLYDVLGKPTIRPREIPLTDADGVKIVHDEAGERVRTKDGKKWRETGEVEKGYVLQTRPETPGEFRDRLRADIASAPEAYFQRGEVVRLEEEERDAAFDVWRIGQEIRDASRMGRWARNPDACVRYGRTCDFWPVCSRTGSLDDPQLYRRSAQVHRELSQPQPAPQGI